MAAHVERTQRCLGRRISVENPSSYLCYHHSTMGEAEFLAALVQRTGCEQNARPPVKSAA